MKDSWHLKSGRSVEMGSEPKDSLHFILRAVFFFFYFISYFFNIHYYEVYSHQLRSKILMYLKLSSTQEKVSFSIINYVLENLFTR